MPHPAQQLHLAQLGVLLRSLTAGCSTGAAGSSALAGPGERLRSGCGLALLVAQPSLPADLGRSMPS